MKFLSGFESTHIFGSGTDVLATTKHYEMVEQDLRLARATERTFIFTKCGMPWDESGRIVHSLRRQSIRRECEASLKRLGVDAIETVPDPLE